jgi:hypothetical protein
MHIKKQVIDDTEDEYISQKLERKLAFLNKVRSGNRPYPKESQQLISASDILGDLEYPLKAFPEAAIQAALSRKDEMIPLLLRVLGDAVFTVATEDDDTMAPLFALYILSQFREQRAFPLIIEFARLPEEKLDQMIGDTLTENFQQFIGSTYDGNLEMIKALIEDPQTCIWSRSAALRSLLVLFKEGILERGFILSYIKDLFHHASFIDDEGAMAILIGVACDLYPDEIYTEIKEAYEKDRVNTTWIGIRDVDRTLQLGKEEALRRNIYENSHFDVITDVIEETKWWAYAKGPEKKSMMRKESFFDSSSIPFKREMPKIGRNDPCLCGSGKKYKKCCLGAPTAP